MESGLCTHCPNNRGNPYSEAALEGDDILTQFRSLLNGNGCMM
ncbi:MAG: hypothetical protein P8X79_17950 [Reinekea sp.]